MVQQEEILYFPITVDDCLSGNAQSLVKRSCGDAVIYLDVVHLATRHQSKIWVGLKAGAFATILSAVIGGLPGAELGVVKHIHSQVSHAA